ncbi:MAG: GNAT family N-acetyltransferase, partial [Acidimicrobiia bacterium]
MQRRRFNGVEDLAAMQELVAERTEAMGVGSNLHPGDVAHRIYSGLRRERLDDVVLVWMEADRLEAFALLWPKYQAFDVVTSRDLDDEALRTVVTEAVEAAEGKGRVETDLIGDDHRLRTVLEDLGFTWFEDGYVFTAQQIPALSISGAVEVNAGDFEVRSVTRDDAAALAEVHARSFGSSWTTSEYETLMSSPGYIAENELVVVDSDGTFAGFTVTWNDRRNRIGYFEPVGVHENFRRQGVGSLLLAEGVRRMQAAGMTHATVWHDASDERSGAFYAANGFERVSLVT